MAENNEWRGVHAIAPELPFLPDSHAFPGTDSFLEPANTCSSGSGSAV
jgi:hypothetical protein